MGTQNPRGTPAVRRGSSGRCPVSKSGECLKSVSASVDDHPACVYGCDRAHHIPGFCLSCGGKLVRWRSRHLDEPFWWCGTCRSAAVCNCDGCQVMRALGDS